MIDGKPTFWNARPASCRRVRVVVGDTGRFPQYWARLEGLVGEEVDAVEVVPSADAADPVTLGPGVPFYILDTEGQGTAKVTTGRGSSLVGHRSLDIERVLGDT